MTLTRADVQRLLADHSLRPSRALGQNFVVDPNTVRRIVHLAGVEPGSDVVEVGAGLGSLTVALAEAGARVVALEVDRHLIPILGRVVSGLPVRVVEGDALRCDWPELLGADQGPWALIANLPYNVATPVVLRALEEAPAIRTMLVMVQREVAERMGAHAGDEAYGAVSVKVDYWARASVVGRVPPTVFVPRPQVESALVRIERRSEPAVAPDAVPYGRLFAVVRAGFAKRRKMLRGALAGVVAPEAFGAAGVDPRSRAEELGVQDWGRLAAWPAPSP